MGETPDLIFKSYSDYSASLLEHRIFLKMTKQKS